MIIRNLAIWIAERTAEIASGGVLMFLLWGRSYPPGTPLLSELGLTLSLAAMFCLMSGYIITCAVMGLRAVRRPPVRHGAAIGWAFLLHSMLFFTMFGPGGWMARCSSWWEAEWRPSSSSTRPEPLPGAVRPCGRGTEHALPPRSPGQGDEGGEMFGDLAGQVGVDIGDGKVFALQLVADFAHADAVAGAGDFKRSLSKLRGIQRLSLLAAAQAAWAVTMKVPASAPAISRRRPVTRTWADLPL